MSNPSPLSTQRAMALLRVGLGAWLVWMALPNLDRSFIDHLPNLVETWSAGNPYGVYQWLLNQVILPNAETVGAMLPVAQLLVGASLVIGFLARYTSVLGLVYALNLAVMSSHLGVIHQGFGVVLALCFLTFVLADAGQMYGLDGWLFKPASGEPSHKSLKSAKNKAKKKAKTAKFKHKKQQEVVEALNRKLKGKNKKTAKVSSRRFDEDDEDDDE